MSRHAPGSQFGPYILREPLGRGAFAEVWLAENHGDHGFRTRLALKLLKENDDRARVDELLAEARLVATLSHPNVVGVLGVGQEQGTWYVAMEYVDGGTVESLIADLGAEGLAVPHSVAARIGLDVARGLAVAHGATAADGARRPIIHRDLKPANVLLSTAGFAKVGDFGLAKVRGAATATASGMLKGTPAYVAPEIWRGGREFSPQVDLFALGCVIYEVALGHRLMGGESMEAIFGQASFGDPDAELAPLAAACPPLAGVVRDLIERDPDRRADDASAVADRLATVVQELDVGCDLETFLALRRRLSAPSDAPLGSRGTLRLPEVTSGRWSTFIARTTGRSLPVDEGLILGDRSDPSPPPSSPLPDESEGEEVSGVRPPAPATGRPRWLVPSFVGAALLIGAGLVAGLRSPAPPSPPPPSQSASAPPPTPEAQSTILATEVDLAEVLAEVAAAAPPASRSDDVTTGRAGRREADPPASAGGEDAAPPTDPVPKPSEQAVEEPTAPAAEEPMLETATAQESSGTPDGCLLLASHPPGALVWIRGERAARPARSRPSRGQRIAPGTLQVGMGLAEEPMAEVTLSIGAGEAVLVECRVGGSTPSCGTRPASPEACGPTR